MTLSERIGILLFLYTRNELSEAEQAELSAWRLEAPENEQLFQELADPDFMRITLREYYRERDAVFQKLKQRFPWLADAKLSNEPGFEDPDPEEQLYLEQFPDKQLAESGLSKPEFWRTMIPDALLSADEYPGEEEEPVPSIAESRTPGSFTKKRNLLIGILAAAGLVLGIVYFFGGSESGGGVHELAIFTPDGTRYTINDYNRGNLAGQASISFEHTDKGETIWVYTSESNRKKTDRYTLASGAGKGFILKLPDGTRIRMNSQSAISYPANFSQDTIALNLEGEAFFDLPDHSSHQYIIGSERKALEVLVRETALNLQGAGSQKKLPQLNISSYSTDSGLQVTGIGGAVDIVSKTIGQEISLLPGRQVILDKGKAEQNVAVDTAQVIAWKNGDFNFREQMIQRIMPEVARWYDLNVSYQGLIPDKKFTLQGPRTMKLSKVLAILEKQGLRVTRSGREITLIY